MFKIMTLTALSLMLSQAASANYICHRNGNTLTIEHYAPSVDGSVSQVKATLIQPNSEELFTGTYYTSTINNPVAGYSLQNSQGENVGLEIKYVKSYGGRCGRCGDGGTTTTYALLTLPQAETLDYVCE